MIVMDSNVVSELMKSSPDRAVETWALERGDEIYTTVISFAEVHYGVERLPDGKRKFVLRTAAANAFGWFAERVLPFDTPAAAIFPTLVCERERRGLPFEGMDAMIASICRARDADLATRNVKDFVHTGLRVIDPWTEAGP